MKLFKRSLLGILVVIALSLQATISEAAVVSLAWNPNPESDIAGYKVYYGTGSRNYTMSVNVGKFTSCLISGLASNKRYYFACTAYNSSGLESGYSNEVSYLARLRR